MGFTAVLSTTNARPGNVVLAFYQSGPLLAAASVAGLASFASSATIDRRANASLDGASSVEATIEGRYRAVASIEGRSSAQASPEEPLTCPMEATSFFFVNPALTLLISFFEPTALPAALRPVPGLRPAQPGLPLRTNLTGVVVSSLPRKTQTGGVPNEG